MGNTHADFGVDDFNSCLPLGLYFNYITLSKTIFCSTYFIFILLSHYTSFGDIRSASKQCFLLRLFRCADLALLWVWAQVVLQPDLRVRPGKTSI